MSADCGLNSWNDGQHSFTVYIKYFLKKIYGYFSSLWKENYLFNSLEFKNNPNFSVYILLWHSYIDTLYQYMNVDRNSAFQLNNKINTQNVVLKLNNRNADFLLIFFALFQKLTWITFKYSALTAQEICRPPYENETVYFQQKNNRYLF